MKGLYPLLPIVGGILLAAAAAGAQAAADEAPKVPFRLAMGMKSLQSMCAQCHGNWGHGTEPGPPLMHPIDRPSHHGDQSFYRAVLRGAKAHHWNFGDMAAVPGATRQDVERILPFVRWLQAENGIR
jgi:cytochrome c2